MKDPAGDLRRRTAPGTPEYMPAGSEHDDIDEAKASLLAATSKEKSKPSSESFSSSDISSIILLSILYTLQVLVMFILFHVLAL